MGHKHDDVVDFLQTLTEPSLLVACFDTPKAQRTGSSQRQGLVDSYKRRRRSEQAALAARKASNGMSRSTHPQTAWGGLHPFLQHLQQLGAISVVAQDGWEADDCVGAVCAVLEGVCPSLSVTVASSDGDMQQLLSSQVSWLHVFRMPSLEHPLGVELVTAADFTDQHGFEPGAYADWLAFTGKKDANIGGMGTGASTAAKLLRRYGNIEAIAVAANLGAMAGWSPAVQRLFSQDPAGQELLAQLCKQRKLFTINRSTAVLPQHARAELQSRAEQLGMTKQAVTESNEAALQLPQARIECNTSGSGTGKASTSMHAVKTMPTSGSPASLQAALVWAHPFHVVRWAYVRQEAHRLANYLRQLGATVEVQAVSPQGLAVDILVSSGASLLGLPEGKGSVAVLVAGQADFQASSRFQGAVPGASLAQVKQLAVAAAESSGVVRQLHGYMQQYVRQLKKEGLQVLCIPWWQLLA
ncbi:hypothetical protein N2152v2_006337 [Parachlorella kessleri]